MDMPPVFSWGKTSDDDGIEREGFALLDRFPAPL